MYRNISLYDYYIAKACSLIWALIRKIIGRRRFKRFSYNGQKILNFKEGNKLIAEKLIDNKPFMISRFGDVELRTVVYAIEIGLGIRKNFPQYVMKKMQVNAGFFPITDKNLFRFGELMIDSCSHVDVFGVWYNVLEDYVIKKFAPNSKTTILEALEPFWHSEPWSSYLKSKKVLVIHPFEATIISQFKKREFLFQDIRVLPEFELLTLKAVQSNAGEETCYENWFDALDEMTKKALTLDFDVAIIGCGAYGLPLAANLKKAGKQAIHLGGATQLLFGIRGARWDARPEMQRFINEDWVRPSLEEKPKDAENVEGGCYW